MSSNQFLDDYDIIKGCLQNNAAMQKMLYDKYSAKMYGIALRYTHDQEKQKIFYRMALSRFFKT